MGNPGTGKTRMARSLAKVLGTMGIFVYDNTQEVYRSDFVADYEGQTAGKTRRLLEGNLEKVIFLDEAYMLTTWDRQKEPPMPTSYSAEATGELLTFLENNVGSTCFIAAGYEDKMQDEFLRANPGLTRRFTQYIYIPDYEPSRAGAHLPGRAWRARCRATRQRTDARGHTQVVHKGRAGIPCRPF